MYSWVNIYGLSKAWLCCWESKDSRVKSPASLQGGGSSTNFAGAGTGSRKVLARCTVHLNKVIASR